MLDLVFIYKFLKFGVVGFSGVFVDFGTTYLLKEVVGIEKYFANSIGFTLAASSNYILNRYWTFESTNPHVFIEFSKFFVISLIGLLINSLIIYLFTDVKFKVNFYLSKAIATFIVVVWNFFMNYFFTF